MKKTKMYWVMGIMVLFSSFAFAESMPNRTCTELEVTLAEQYRDYVLSFYNIGYMTPVEVLEAQTIVLDLKRCIGYLSKTEYCARSVQLIDSFLSGKTLEELKQMSWSQNKNLLLKIVQNNKECN